MTQQGLVAFCADIKRKVDPYGKPFTVKEHDNGRFSVKMDGVTISGNYSTNIVTVRWGDGHQATVNVDPLGNRR